MKVNIGKYRVSLYQVFLHLIVVLLAIEVVLLLGEMRTLRKGGADIRKQILHEGDSVQVVGLVSLSGEKRVFPDTAKKRNSVLFLFHTKCPYCKDNIPHWNSLAEMLKKDSIDVVAVSIHSKDATAEYVRTNNLRVDTFIPLDSLFYRIYRPVAVPQTIIISPGLKVLRNYTGVVPSQGADSAAIFLSHTQSLTNR